MRIFHTVNDYRSEHEPWHDLAVAVIRQAVADYRSLGAKLTDDGSPIEKRHIEENMKSISRFFLSDWFRTFSGYENGAQILEALDREVFGDD